jgi:hypothetical protein
LFHLKNPVNKPKLQVITISVRVRDAGLSHAPSTKTKKRERKRMRKRESFHLVSQNSGLLLFLASLDAV